MTKSPRSPLAPEMIEVPLDQIFCPCCTEDLGAAIRQLPDVIGAHIDLEHKVAHVTVHPGMTDAETLRKQIADCNLTRVDPQQQISVSQRRTRAHT